MILLRIRGPLPHLLLSRRPIGLRPQWSPCAPRVFLHSVHGTTPPRCALMAAINFVRTPSNNAYGSCPEGPAPRRSSSSALLWGLHRGGESTNCSHQRHHKAEDRAHAFSTVRFLGCHADRRS